MNTTVDIDPRLLAAATAAAGALWSPAPLEPAEPVAAASAAAVLPAGGSAFVASFTGSSHGTVLVVVDAEMAQTLATSGIGALSLSDAARGVLEAAAASTGPVALGPVTAVDAAAALAKDPSLVVFPMTADGTVHAVVALSISEKADAKAGPGAPRAAYDLLLDVEMDVTAELGRTRMTVRSLLDLEPGAIVELDRMAGSPVDLLVNGRLIARGEVVVVDEEFALRVTEIVASAVEADR
jgi:flagellar motor switch protein FliN/FliY